METNSIYMVTYFRPYPPGDPFHWGMYIKTADAPGGTLFHATQMPSWAYASKSQSFMSSMSSILAAKIGSVPETTTTEQLYKLFEAVSVGESSNYSNIEWRCNHWVRDATRLLVAKGWIDCADVDGLWAEVKASALLYRESVIERTHSPQIVQATLSK